MSEVPSSYYEAVSGAVARLGRNTRAARRQIYDRARLLLLEEAHSANPPWQLMEVVREQRALEEAIEEVEAEYSTDEAREPEPPPAPGERSAPGGRRPPFFASELADEEDMEERLPVQQKQPEPPNRRLRFRPLDAGKTIAPERPPSGVEHAQPARPSSAREPEAPGDETEMPAGRIPAHVERMKPARPWPPSSASHSADAAPLSHDDPHDEQSVPSREPPDEAALSYPPLHQPLQPPPSRPGRRTRPGLKPRPKSPVPLQWLWLLGGVVASIVVAVLLFLWIAPLGGSPQDNAPQATREQPFDRAIRAQDYLEEGNERSRARDYDGAITAFSEAIRLGLHSPVVYNNRAFAHWSRGQTDRAIADYDRALEIDPDNIIALTNRAIGYNFRGQYELALRDLDRALMLEPGNPGILNSRCWGRALAGRPQEALADCNEALRLRPNDQNALDSRGFAYMKLGDFDRAIADYDAALRIDPKLAASLYGRGLAKIQKGDEAEGHRDLAAARAIRPEIEAIFARYGL